MIDSKQLYERARQVLPGGSTRSTLFVSPHPPYATRGAGAVVTDSSGHRLIDCNNNYTSLIHGHAHPGILREAFEAAHKGSAFGLPTELEVEFAELLQDRTTIPNWRFCNSGTEAVMMMLRAARAHTGRDKIVRFDGSYHGTYDGVVGDDSPGIASSIRGSFIVLPQNDEKAFLSAMSRHGHSVAAVLVDLMPNRAGLRPAPKSMVDLIRRTTIEYGSLMAVDEVITFRLGLGGLHSHYGIVPDLVSVAKIIGGGFPVGAIGGRRDVLNAFNPTQPGKISWGGTFSANPVTLAAGLETLQLFNASAIGQLNASGDALRRRIDEAGIVVSGYGSLLRLQSMDLESTWWELYESGVLLGTNGLIALSTAMSDDQIRDVGDRVLAASSLKRRTRTC